MICLSSRMLALGFAAYFPPNDEFKILRGCTCCLLIRCFELPKLLPLYLLWCFCTLVNGQWWSYLRPCIALNDCYCWNYFWLAFFFSSSFLLCARYLWYFLLNDVVCLLRCELVASNVCFWVCLNILAWNVLLPSDVWILRLRSWFECLDMLEGLRLVMVFVQAYEELTVGGVFWFKVRLQQVLPLEGFWC